MTQGAVETRSSSSRGRLLWGLRVLVVVLSALPLGLFALVYVIDGIGGMAGQTPWLQQVLDHELPTYLVFAGAPIVLGVAASWGVHRLGSGRALSVVAGPLTVVAYLYALVVLGTGLGPFDVRP